MGFLKKIKYVLSRCDFFPHNQFLCYKDEADYTTATGGIASVIIIIAVMLLVTSEALNLVEKQKVTSTIEYIRSRDPSYSQMSLSPSGGFMFNIGIQGVNLANFSSKAFKVELFQQSQDFINNVYTDTSILL
jgi:hypothetical protein